MFPVNNGIYYLKHRKTGKLLEAKNHESLSLSSLQGEPIETQLWRLRRTPDGRFLITELSDSDRMLSAAGEFSGIRGGVSIDFRPEEKEWREARIVKWIIEKGHEAKAFYVVNGIGRVLDASGDGVYTYDEKNKDGFQMWEFVDFDKAENLFFPIDNGIYCIKHKKTGKLLTSKRIEMCSLSELEMGGKPKESQLWRLRKSSIKSLSYLIAIGVASENVLSAEGNTLNTYSYWHPQEESWRLKHNLGVNWKIEKGHEAGAFYIVNTMGKVLDGNENSVYLSNDKNKDGFQMWELTYFKEGEEFFFPVNNGIYYFKHKETGKLLEARDRESLSLSSLQGEPSETQLWRIRRTPNGRLLIAEFLNSDRILCDFQRLSTSFLDKGREWRGVKPVEWRIEQGHEAGAFYVVNGYGRVLDGSGSSVYSNDKNKDGFQMWELISYVKLTRIASFILRKLKENFSSAKDLEWGVSYNNEFPEGWIMQVPPKEFWGKSEVEPSETERKILNPIGEAIKKANKLVDIMTLTNISGKFMSTLIDSIKNLEERKKTVTVRIFLGTAWTEDEKCKEVYDQITKTLTLNYISVKVASGKTKADLYDSNDWSHAKIVVIDEKDCIIGGMNMWGEDYLNKTPVHDVSVYIRGDAAKIAQGFVKEYWEKYAKKTCEMNTPNTNKSQDKESDSVIQEPHRRSPIIAVGRFGNVELGKAPSDVALLEMLFSAKKNIYMSQQSLFLYKTAENSQWEVLFLDTIKRALRDNGKLTAKIVTSYPSQKSPRYKSYGYGGVSVGFTQNRFTEQVEKESEILSRLHILAMPGNQGNLAFNHAKVVIVDDEVAYIGSQNMYATYPVKLAEFGLIIADQEKVKELVEEYWNKLWKQCLDLVNETSILETQ